MAISFDPLSTVKRTVLGFFQSKLSGWALGPKDFFGKLAAVAVLVHYQFLRTARQIDLDAVPSDNTSTAGLDEWAANGVGLADGFGGFGRKKATTATGGSAPLTGVAGTVYANGLTLTASDGFTKFVLVNGPLTIPGVAPATGSIEGTINAATAGAVGNRDAGTELTFDSPPMGSDATVTLDAPLKNGFDVENNATVLQRIRRQLRFPPKAITPSDLVELAEGVAGVDVGYVFPLRNGTGTWDVLPTQAGTGTTRDPGDPTVAGTVAYAVAAALVAGRNTTVEGARTVRPRFAGTGLAIKLRVTPTPTQDGRYGFEWDEQGNAFGVVAYNAGAHTLQLTIDAADIAVQLAAGHRPRVQVITTGVVLPQQAVVTGYNSGTQTCTLDPASIPGSWATHAPQAGDAVYAGGPVVNVVAAAVLGLVDSLGPSKASGYADQSASWDDTLRIDQLRRAALNATDSGGARLVLALPQAPQINGSADDVEAGDTLLTSPEVLWAQSIAIVQ